MEEARLRAEYEGARGAAAAARAGGGAGAVAELTGCAGALRRGADALAPGPGRDQWGQRAAWVRQELLAVAAEALGGGGAGADPARFWGNVIDALGACVEHGARAATAETQEAEGEARAQAALRAEVEAARAHAETLAKELAEARRNAPSVGPSQVEEGGSAVEAVQLRAQLGARIAELERLQAQVQELQEELREERGREPSRPATAYPEPPEPSQEVHSAGLGAEKLGEQVEALRGHNRLLSQNLENHARVVEKLVELNAELMGANNARSLEAEQRYGESEGAGGGLDKAESAEDKGDVSVSGAPRPLAVEAGPVQAPAAADAEPKPGAEIANAFAAFLTEDDPLSPRRASDIMDPPSTNGNDRHAQ